jgi:hypothetical protein
MAGRLEDWRGEQVSATDKPKQPPQRQSDIPVAPERLSATATIQKSELLCPVREVDVRPVCVIALSRFSSAVKAVHEGQLENSLPSSGAAG